VADRSLELARPDGGLREDALLAQLMRSVGAIAWEADADGRVTFVSDGASSVIGVPAETLLGQGFRERAVHADDAVRFAAALAQTAADGRTREVAHRLRGAGGEDIAAVTVVSRAADGAETRLAGLTREVRGGAPPEADERLRFQALLLDTVGQAVIATDLEGRITYWNRAAERIYGWSAAQAVGRNIIDVTPQDDPEVRERAGEIMARLQRGEPWSGEFPVRASDGRMFPAIVTNAPILDSAGNLTGIVGVSSDLSALKAAEDAVRERDERYRRLADSVPALVSVAGPDGTVEYFNRRWYEYTGLSREESERRAWRAVIHPDDWSRVFEEARAAIRRGEGWEVEFRARREDGAYRWHHGRSVAVRDAAGAVTAWVASAMDIHERKVAETALRDSERRYREFAEALPIIIGTCTPAGDVTYANECWYQYTGEQRGPGLAERFRQAVHPDDRARAHAAWERVLAAGDSVFDVDYRLRRHDGAYRWHRSHSVAVRDRNGDIAMWIGAVAEVHEQRMLEDALRVSEARYRSLAEAAPQIVWTVRRDGRMNYFNQRWYAYTGLPQGSPFRGDWVETLHPDDREAVIAARAGAMARGAGWEHECRLRRADGAYRWHLVRVVPVDTGSDDVCWIGTSTDIDAQKRAEEAARISEQRYRSVADAAPALVAAISTEGRREFVNRRWIEYTGLPERELLGAPAIDDVMHPDDRERVGRAWDAARERGEPMYADYRVRRYDGTYRWHASQTVPVRRDDGTIIEWVSNSFDIDDRKRAAEIERFLSDASARLAESLEFTAAVEVITSAAVPYLGDGCALHLSDDAGKLRLIAAQYPTPALGEGASGAELDPEALAGAPAVMRGAPAELMADATLEGLLAAGVEAGRARALLGAGLRSHMTVPLRVRTRTIGALSLLSFGERRLDERDLTVAQEFADRAAAALENARLYQEARDAERETEEARALLDTLLSSAPVGVAFWDRDLRYVQLNDTLARMHGAPVEEHLGRTAEEVLPGVAPAVIEAQRRVVFGGEPLVQVEIAWDANPGETRWWNESFYPVRRADGEVIGVGVVALDITDRRRAELALQDSEQRLAGIIASAMDAIVMVDHSQRITVFNRAAEEMFRCPADVAIGRRLDTFIPERFRRLHRGHIRDFAETGVTTRTMQSLGELLGRRFDGEEFPIEATISQVEIAGERFFTAIVRDVSERRRAEEERRVNELRYRTLADALPQIVWTAASDGSIDYYSERWSEYTGLGIEASEGRGWEQAVHPDDIERATALWRASVETGDHYEVEYRLRRRDGEYRWHLGRAVPIRAVDDRILAWFGSSTDIDDRKREEIRQRFISEATNALATSLDYEATLATLARLAVPDMADWCAVDLVAGDGIERVAVAHVDPAKEQWALEMQRRYPPVTDANIGVAAVIRSGVAELYSEGEELLGRPGLDPERVELVRSIGFTSLIIAPIVVRGEAVGAISLVSAESKRHFTPADSSVAEELGRRAGIAIENAQLYDAERAARRAAEEAGSKLSFLAEASRLLASSLDYDATLRQLARLAAPTLGDWCAVDLIEDGRLRRVATAYADRAQEPAAREFARRIPLDLDAEGGAPRVIREGRPVLVPRVTDRELRQVARDPEPLRLLHRARLRSYMCVPLIARGRTLGAMTFITAQGERELTAEDLRLAEDLAARAATAVDNARLFAEAQTIAAELRVANQAKDEFLGLVSHELRTPITTIFGNAQVLRNRANRLDDESRALAVEDIEQEAERLHRIIDNMLVLSRVEAGREIETEPLVVERTLRRIIDSYAQRHPQRPIELRTEGRVAPVSAEPTYFEQIVRNLLSNADKYSPPGAPIEVTARPDGTAAVVVSVADRGKGIPPEEMGLIFRTFFRSPRTSAQASGAGIGLAVCKRLVEVQGGRIWARAREGGGTEFGFSLPLEKESKP